MDQDRITRLKAAMKKAGLGAVFVSNPKNVKYLTGFQTMMPGEVQGFGDPEGFMLVHRGRFHFLCDGRYIEGARQLAGVNAVQLKPPVNAKNIAGVIKGLLARGTKTVGIEEDALLYADGVGLKKHLKGVRVMPAEGIFSELRVCKTAQEVKLIRKAEDITSDCFDHIAKFIRLGMSERDVAMEVDRFMRSKSEGNSFDPIVAFGATCCNPHYVPSPKQKLKKGQMVLLDMGAIHKGYCGDMTRMISIGKASPRLREVYAMVLEAQLNCIKAVRPGVTAHDLDMVVRDTFQAQGTLEHFLHGTGHGVGLAIHEDPRIKISFKTKIRPGMVFSVEPGLYFPKWGGVRIEDLVVVTEKGCKNLTRAPKKLLELKR